MTRLEGGFQGHHRRSVAQDLSAYEERMRLIVKTELDQCVVEMLELTPLPCYADPVS